MAHTRYDKCTASFVKSPDQMVQRDAFAVQVAMEQVFFCCPRLSESEVAKNPTLNPPNSGSDLRPKAIILAFILVPNVGRKATF